MSIQVRPEQAVELITTYIKAGIVPIMKGSPGIGKSAIVHQIAKDYNLKLIDLRLAQCDPVDLMGFPAKDEATGKGYYLPMETFPLDTDPVPQGFAGWLLFMDEMTSAPQGVQAAAYKVFLDRMIGLKKLHPKCALVGAGNLETDNAIVETMSTALQSRLAHLELKVDTDAWCDWAASQGFDHRITAYLAFRPDQLFTFKPDHTDSTYGCPRTWEFANRLCKGVPATDPLLIEKLSGVLSEGLAREFVAFCQLEDKLPKISAIVANPKLTAVPDEPSICWALTGALAEALSTHNCDQLMEFISRLPIEFQVVTLRQGIRRTPALVKEKAVIKWIADNGNHLF